MSAQADLAKKLYNATQPSVARLGTCASSISASANASIKQYKDFQYKVKIARIAELEKKYHMLKKEICGFHKEKIEYSIQFLRDGVNSLKKIMNEDKEAIFDWKHIMIRQAEATKRYLRNGRAMTEKMQIISLEIDNIAGSAIRELKKAKKDNKNAKKGLVEVLFGDKKQQIEIASIDGEIAMLSKYSKQLGQRSVKYMQYCKHERTLTVEIDAMIRKLKVAGVK